jgi:hypothetical protein
LTQILGQPCEFQVSSADHESVQGEPAALTAEERAEREAREALKRQKNREKKQKQKAKKAAAAAAAAVAPTPE